MNGSCLLSSSLLSLILSTVEYYGCVLFRPVTRCAVFCGLVEPPLLTTSASSIVLVSSARTLSSMRLAESSPCASLRMCMCVRVTFSLRSSRRAYIAPTVKILSSPSPAWRSRLNREEKTVQEHAVSRQGGCSCPVKSTTEAKVNLHYTHFGSQHRVPMVNACELASSTRTSNCLDALMCSSSRSSEALLKLHGSVKDLVSSLVSPVPSSKH